LDAVNQISRKPSALLAVARRLLAFVAIFVVGLLAAPLFGFFPLFPRIVRNSLFFWPQTALAPYGFTHPMDDMTHTYLGGGPNYAIAMAFWLIVGVALSWLLRSKPVRVTALATVPVSLLVGVVVTTLLGVADIGIYYEGP
jgi:hypothetical protein